MRTVVIVLLDPARDAQPGLGEVLIFVEPHLLFFQAAMEPFDVAVALGMVVCCAPVRDAEPIQSFDITCVPLSVVNVKPVPRESKGKASSTARLSAARASSGAAVDHRNQIRPAHTRPRPDLGHVRLPDVIGMRRFYLAPVLLP